MDAAAATTKKMDVTVGKATGTNIVHSLRKAATQSTDLKLKKKRLESA